MVLLSAQGMDVPAIAKVPFISEDRARDVIRNFNADGFAIGGKGKEPGRGRRVRGCVRACWTPRSAPSWPGGVRLAEGPVAAHERS